MSASGESNYDFEASLESQGLRPQASPILVASVLEDALTSQQRLHEICQSRPANRLLRYSPIYDVLARPSPWLLSCQLVLVPA